jgi:hypothetical protein
MRATTRQDVTFRSAHASSEATRYLCAGAYLDSDFAQAAIHAILEEEHQAVSPSHGIDLRPILGHCLAARRRRATQAGAILAVLFLDLLLFRLQAIGFIVSMVWVWVLLRISRWSRRRRPRSAGGEALRLVALPILYWWIALTVAGMVVLPFLLALRAASRATAFAGAETVSPGPLPVFLGALLGFVLIVMLPWAIVFGGLLGRRVLLGTKLSKEHFNPDDLPVEIDPFTRRRLHRLTAEQYGNATVYSGYRPFIGTGDRIRTWSLPIRLDRGSSDPADSTTKPPQPFRLATLRDYIVQRIDLLGSDELEPAERLRGLSTEDRVFVNGATIRKDGRFLPDPWRRPVTTVTDEQVEAILHDPTGTVRHYLCVRIGSWEEELVLSTLIHLARTSNTLYVEVTEALLPPIRWSYHEVDALPPRPSPMEGAALLWRSLCDLPQTLVSAPMEVARSLLSPARRALSRASLKQAIEHDLAFDFGAKVSLRELAAADTFHYYFQRLDTSKHIKLIELHLLNAILDFLEMHGVDTREYRRQQQVILNTGIFMTGGKIVSEAMAVGQQATATTGGDSGKPDTSAAGGEDD